MININIHLPFDNDHDELHNDNDDDTTISIESDVYCLGHPAIYSRAAMIREWHSTVINRVFYTKQLDASITPYNTSCNTTILHSNTKGSINNPYKNVYNMY